MQLNRYTTKNYTNPPEVNSHDPSMAHLLNAARDIFCLPVICKWESMAYIHGWIYEYILIDKSDN